jgi:hypothetical protein
MEETTAPLLCGYLTPTLALAARETATSRPL